MVNSFWRRHSYTFFPGFCQLCLSKTGDKSDICAGCWSDLPWLGGHCRHCALPLPTSHPTTGELCAHCQQTPPHFDDCLAAWIYTFPVDRMISQFKYQRRRPLGRQLAELWLAEHYPVDRPDLLVAVPMHWRRLWLRGFNQAHTLARLWSEALDISLYRGLRRRRHTPRQQGLDARSRQRNLHDAFELRDPQAIAGCHIAIVDDVVTTGATANSLAVILREAGAARVSVWCLARTP